MRKQNEIDRYIELMYSKDSEFNKIDDLNERKERAAVKAGLDIAQPETKNMMELKNEHFRVKVVNYLQKQQPNDFIKLLADQQLFFNMQQRLMKPLDDDDDTSKLMQISEQSEYLIERIEKFKKKIYLQPELIEEAEKKIRVMTPEMRLKEQSKNSA